MLPDLTAPTVTILAEAPGMDPLEIESLVTFPIESALNGAAGVRRVRSATAVGVAVVWVEFDWGQDINRARQTVTREAHARLGLACRRTSSRHSSRPVSSIMGEVLFIDLESDRHSPLELRTVAETVVRRRLLAVPGVSQVIATGGEQKQYEVVLDPARLAAHQVTLEEVEEGADRCEPERDRGLSGRAGAGIPRARRRTPGRHRRDRGGQRQDDGRAPVLVRDVGIVREGAAIKRGEGRTTPSPPSSSASRSSPA